MIKHLDLVKLHNLVTKFESQASLDELGRSYFKNYGHIDSIDLQPAYDEFQIAKLLHEKACKQYPTKHKLIAIGNEYKCQCGFSYTM